MAVGIKVEEDRDYRGKFCYLITKNRGKLSQGDIVDAMNSEELYGNYALLIKANGEPYGNTGWDDGTDPKGDTAIIYPVDEFNECPVCGYDPYKDNCRHCGKDLREV